MKKRSFSSLIAAFAVTWAAGASAAVRKSASGSLSGGNLRSFTAAGELKANKTIPPTNGGGRNGGAATTSGPAAQNFGFGRPLKKPVIKKSAPKAGR